MVLVDCGNGVFAKLRERIDLGHRVGAGDEDLRVALEHVEETVLFRHDRANNRSILYPQENRLTPMTTKEARGLEASLPPVKDIIITLSSGSSTASAASAGENQRSARSPRSGQASAWRVTSSG